MVMIYSDQMQVLYLLDRPSEPIFIPKGRDSVFFVPPDNEYLAKRYQTRAEKLKVRFRGQSNNPIYLIPIKYPDVSFAMQLPRTDSFCLFLPYHREMTESLIDIFMDAKNVPELLSVAGYCRDRVHSYMWVYAFCVAILHRRDTKRIQLPALSEIICDKFMDGSVFGPVREQCMINDSPDRRVIDIDMEFTATDVEPEHRLAYFREDIGINLHHWHWHLVYPFRGRRDMVEKDRRGELFYYMHQQIQARYNFERLCNGLERVKRLLNLREPIEEGYFPKLDTVVASRNYPPRPAGTLLSDINRESEQIKFDIADLERWTDRIVEAIQVGRVMNEKFEYVDLTEERGIDILGNIVEASILSINRNLYGDLHNFGHYLLGLPHDPDRRYLETFSVMSDPTTAMRDPLFYRWHAFTDDLFQMHKKTLPPYPANKLDYQDIRIKSLEVRGDGPTANQMTTFWQRSRFNVTHSLDFAEGGDVSVRIAHLQHRRFDYVIEVENNTSAERMGTVRIFLAPKFDESGQPLLFRDQRIMFIELDKFVVTLARAPKLTIIRKNSEDSTLTIPFVSTFDELDPDEKENDGESRDLPKVIKRQMPDYCGCGWPLNMLIPKGSPEGFPCQLFVMVSDIKDDVVEGSGGSNCVQSVSFCGIRDSKYPDRRPMGYPFDRVPRARVDTLQQFLTPNMAVTDVRIVFDSCSPPEDVDMVAQNLVA